jgi:hypothetical protein
MGFLFMGDQLLCYVAADVSRNVTKFQRLLQQIALATHCRAILGSDRSFP